VAPQSTQGDAGKVIGGKTSCEHVHYSLRNAGIIPLERCREKGRNGRQSSSDGERVNSRSAEPEKGRHHVLREQPCLFASGEGGRIAQQASGLQGYQKKKGKISWEIQQKSGLVGLPILRRNYNVKVSPDLQHIKLVIAAVELKRKRELGWGGKIGGIPRRFLNGAGKEVILILGI